MGRNTLEAQARAIDEGQDNPSETKAKQPGNLGANLYKTERSLRDFVLPDVPTFQAGKQVKSASLVARWPQKIVRLPWGIDASAFLNTSENFSANGSNTDAYGTLLPSAKGTTRETGLNFAFLNNRFSLRVNRYETRIKDQNLGRISALG
eukprot:gene47645-58371_t